MRYPLSETVAYEGPTCFDAAQLQDHRELFIERAALIFTPTEALPAKFVGHGALNIFIPVVPPDYYECHFNRSFMSPRLWLDLIQRQTQKIRWIPHRPACVRFTRYDTFQIRSDHYIAGTKALMDALKVQTTGRSDRRLLYYFGAIWDDGPNFVDTVYESCLVDDPALAGIRIEVTSQPLPEAKATRS